MSQLDGLISRLQPGQELLLESNKEPAVRTADGLKAVIARPLTAAQITSLISEISCSGGRDGIKDGNASFDYVIGNRRHLVSFMQNADSVRAVISHARGGSYETEPTIDHTPAAAAGNAAITEAASIPRIKETAINKFLRKMVEMESSDLHLVSNNTPYVRESGDIVEIPGEESIPADKMKEMIYEIMPAHNVAQFEATQDTDFPYDLPGIARFRVNVFMDRHGIGAVLRQIPMEIITAEKLGLSKEILDLCFLNKGLVLVTGPTGSGKSTTLCALIDYINRNRKDHIITIEDPIEFVHPHKRCLINQREVHVHTKSFSSALRAALREDPDIILVGEMRDLETISIALETAETGHLVFGTLHTTTAASTVDRIVDQFPADRQQQIRTMLASSLKGVISQTLCKKAPKGRVAAQEVLFVTTAVSNLIREGKIYQIPSVIQTSKSLGMVMLNDALVELVAAKKVAPEEAYAKSVDKAGFTGLLKARGINLQTLNAG